MVNTIILRNGKIELLRCLSMIMVLVLHYLLFGGVLDKMDVNMGVKYYIAWLLEALSYVAVNVFVIISGYFLSSSKSFKPGKVLNIIIQCWFYSVFFYAVACLCSWHKFYFPTFVTVYLLPLTSGKWWFVGCYVVLYLCVPYLNILHNNLNKKQHLAMLFIFGVLFSIIPTIVFWANTSTTINKGYSLVWFIYLYFVATYIRKYSQEFLPKIPWGCIYILASVLTWGIKILQEVYISKFYWSSYQYISFPVLVASISLFMFFKNWSEHSPSSGLDKIGCIGGRRTLSIFLIHMHNSIHVVLWNKWCKSGVVWLDKEILYCIGHLLFWVIAIFIVCEVIDFLRGLLFNHLEVRLSKWQYNF